MKRLIMVLTAFIFLVACQSDGRDIALEQLNKEDYYFEKDRKELIKRLSLQDDIEHFTFGIPDLPGNLNPLTFDEKDESASIIIHSIYRNLFQYDEDKDEITYDLLANLEVKDNQYYNLKLNNVLWDDGHPLTVDDIIFTIERTFAEETRYDDDFLIGNKKPVFEKVNDYELEIKLDQPSHSFIYKLSNLLVVPRHIYKDVEVHSFGVRPEYLVGNNIYKFDKEIFDTDFGLSRFRFVVNEFSEKKKPKFDILDYRVTGYSETNTSRYDMEAYNIQAGYVGAMDVPAFNNEYYNFSYFDDSTVSLVFKTNTEIGKNKELRKAISALVPPSSVVGLYGSKSFVSEANTIFSANNPYRLADPAFDQWTVQEALSILTEYQLGNPDFVIRFGFLIDIGNPQERLAIQLQEAFRTYGINIEIIPLFKEEYDYLLKDLDQDVVDLMICHLPANTNPFDYKKYFEPEGGSNYTAYKSKELVDLFNHADKELDNLIRLKLYQEIQEKINDECVLVPLVYCKKALGVDDRISNWQEARPNPYSFFDAIDQLGYQPLDISDQEIEDHEIKPNDLIKERPYENVNIKTID